MKKETLTRKWNHIVTKVITSFLQFLYPVIGRSLHSIFVRTFSLFLYIYIYLIGFGYDFSLPNDQSTNNVWNWKTMRLWYLWQFFFFFFFEWTIRRNIERKKRDSFKCICARNGEMDSSKHNFIVLCQ